MSEFKPNNLKVDDIDNLEDWQLLVAGCHFAPGMGDCVSLDYGYTKKGDTIYCGKVSLDGDIDIKDPESAIRSYLQKRSWRELCKQSILDALAE
jgi:hypothetical protein